MKKILSILGLIAACQLQAQTYYVGNNNGTYQAIETDDTHEMTFDAENRLITITLNDETKSRFATDAIDSIAFVRPSGTELTYTNDFGVIFDENDATSYNEIIETIITDELIDESGDFIENYSVSKSVTIIFSETGVTYTPSIVDGITFTIKNGTHLVIDSSNKDMCYIIKGECSDGSIKIYSQKKFQMMLSGLTLTNQQGPAINIQSGKTVYLTLGAGSINTLCDGEIYTEPTTAGEDQKGTLFSEGQLIFNGRGTLNVTSYGGHAICSDDYIRIRSGKINILGAAKDGFHTNDMFRVGRMKNIAAPEINITSTGDAVDCGKGEVIIEAGCLIANSGGEGIKVSYEELVPDTLIKPNATIRGGFISITTIGEKSSAIKTTGNFTQTGGIIQSTVKGNGSKIVNCDGNIAFTNGKLSGIVSGTQSSDTTSAGGFKCDGNIIITGGTIAMECTGKGSKGINCNGNMIVDGGEITLISTAENYTQLADDKKSRAITTVGYIQNGGTVRAKAYDNAIHSESIELSDGVINAFSHNASALNTDATQTGGWLLTRSYWQPTRSRK